VEAQNTAVLWLDGLGDPRDSAKPAVHGHGALERLAVRPRPGQREVQAASAAQVGLALVQDETLRIVGNELFDKAQTRTRVAQNNDKRLKSGGKPRYLLSGLLTCSVCGAHYILADARSYSCSGHSQGGACSNRIRVRRTKIESIILDPIRKELLEPQPVTRMAEEMEATCAERIKAATERAVGT
jgi:hypothetical protein